MQIKVINIEETKEKKTRGVAPAIKAIPIWSFSFEFRDGLFPMFCNIDSDRVVEIVKIKPDSFIIIALSEETKKTLSTPEELQRIEDFLSLNDNYFGGADSIILDIQTFAPILEGNFTNTAPIFGLKTLFLSYDRTDYRICMFYNPDINKYKNSHVYATLLGQLLSESVAVKPKNNTQTSFSKKFLSALACVSLGLGCPEIDDKLLDFVNFPSVPEEAFFLNGKFDRFNALFTAALERHEKQKKKEERQNPKG